METKKSNHKNRVGVVYSTRDDFEFNDGRKKEENTLSPSEQNLVVSIDRKNRKGKSVTLIEGFIGKEEDLKILGKELKTLCGAGGSVKNGIALVQGDFRSKISELLIKKGFRVKGLR